MNITVLLNSDFERIKKIPGGIEKAADLAARWLALEGTNELVKELEKNKSTATSQTLESTKSGLRKIANAHYRIGPTTKHAYYIEKGRDKGKAPPLQKILDWMSVKGIRLPEKEQQRVAFLIARKIGNEGVKAKPFVSVVVERKRWRDDYARLIKPLLNRSLA